MKNIFKIIITAVAAIAVFASCQHKAEFTTYSFVLMDNTSVSVDEDTTAVISVTAYAEGVKSPATTQVSFEIIEGKGTYGEDYTVTPASGVLNFNGDETQYISIIPVCNTAPEDEDIDEDDNPYITGDFTFTIRLTEATDGYTVGGTYETSVTIVDLDDFATWTSLGYCKYTDDFICSLFIGDESYCVTYEVEIQESADTPGLFRLVNPYGEAYPWNDPGDWDDTQDYYIEIHAEDPDGVYIDQQNTGLDWGYGPTWIYSYASYYMDNGYTLEEVKTLGLCGTYYNGVIKFGEDTLLGWLPSYAPSSLYYASDFGKTKIVMPGVVEGDYAVEVSYAGKFTSAADTTFAVASVTSGADVDYVRVALAPANDYEAAIDSLKTGGEIDYQEIAGGNGTAAFECDESGRYAFVVVSYSDEDGAVESNYCTFTFTVGGDSYTPTIEDLVGWYEVSCTSYYGSSYDDEEYWVVDYSDDPDYDIMLTVFDGFLCDYPIYGTFDASTGDFTFYGWQYYCNYYYTYDLWFSSNYDYYISFTLISEGLFANPTDYFGTYLCDYSLTEDDYNYYLGWNNLYTDAIGVRIDSDPSLTSVKGASAKPASVGNGAKTIARPATLPTTHISRQFDKVGYNYPQPAARTYDMSEKANFRLVAKESDKTL